MGIGFVQVVPDFIYTLNVIESLLKKKNDFCSSIKKFAKAFEKVVKQK